MWNNGSSYEGSYNDCFRHGFGNQTWKNGENYRGQFFNDFFHGFGLYSWADGSFYLGTFYMDEREGYGLQYKSTNNTCYEGLFRENMDMGIGRMVYFDDESMDMGFWKDNKLIKFFKYFPDFHILEMISFMHNRTVVTLDDLKLECDILNENLIKKCDQISLNKNEIFVNFLPRSSLSVDRKLFSEAFNDSVDASNIFFKDILGDDVEEILLRISKMLAKVHDDCMEKIYKEEISDEDDIFVIWNKTPSSVLMQKHILRFRRHQNRVSFDIDSLLSKTRLDYKRGLLERLSTELLERCLENNVERVKELLREKQIFVDVCDMNGNSPLIGAAMNGHTEIMDILLDAGAEINRVNDFGVTALMAACLNYYIIGNKIEIGSTFRNLLCNFRNLYPKRELHNTNNTSCKQNMHENSTRTNDSNEEIGKLNITRCKRNITVEQIWFGTKDYPKEDGLDMVDVLNNKTLKASQDLTTFHSTIELLLERGADPNLSLPFCSALHLAIFALDVHSVRLLLENGSDQDVPFLLRDGVEVKPLHIACSLSSKEAVEIVELILGAEADANMPTSSSIGHTSHNNNNDITDNSSSIGDMPNYNNSNNNNNDDDDDDHDDDDDAKTTTTVRVPIELVCLRNSEESTTQRLLQLLIDHKADLNSLFSDGLSPLAHCLLNKKYELARHLLKNGADPNLMLGGNLNSALCLSLTVESNPADQLTLMELLVQHGADVTLPIHTPDGRKVGNFIDYVHRFYAQGALNSELPYYDELALKKNKQKVLDYLSNVARQKLSETWNLDGTSKENLGEICNECGRSYFSRPTKCPKCQSAVYCDKTCRSKAWKDGHKHHCHDAGSRSENISKMATRRLTSSSAAAESLKDILSAQRKMLRKNNSDLKSLIRNKSDCSSAGTKEEKSSDQTILDYTGLSKYIEEFNQEEGKISRSYHEIAQKLNKNHYGKVKSNTLDKVFVGNYSYI